MKVVKDIAGHLGPGSPSGSLEVVMKRTVLVQYMGAEVALVCLELIYQRDFLQG